MYNYLSKNKMKFISGDCGSGKTHSLVQQILRTPYNYYIIVQGTLHLTQQTAQDLGSVARLITSTTSKTLMKI
jgi:hypothetical protein